MKLETSMRKIISENNIRINKKDFRADKIV